MTSTNETKTIADGLRETARALYTAYCGVGCRDADLVKTPEWKAAAALEAKDAEITSLRSQLEDARKAQAWQPIETAPRDGTKVLLYAPGWQAPSTGWTYANDPWQDCPWHRQGELSYEPTHWMPLPPAPTEESRNEPERGE